MASTELISYTIDQSRNRPRNPKKVKGRPFPTKMPGTYAIRKGEVLWVIDHIETGFAVCMDYTEELVTKAFKRLARQHGADGFKKKIALTKRRKTLEAKKVASHA